MCGKSIGPSCSKHGLLNEFIYGEHYLFKIRQLHVNIFGVFYDI